MGFVISELLRALLGMSRILIYVASHACVQHEGHAGLTKTVWARRQVADRVSTACLATFVPEADPDAAGKVFNKCHMYRLLCLCLFISCSCFILSKKTLVLLMLSKTTVSDTRLSRIPLFLLLL